MIFSAATEYAMRGLSELAARGVGGRIMIDELVAGTTLPRDFLAKVFQRLAKAGVLASTKGRGGGFALARPAHAISLLDVFTAMEGAAGMDRCVVGLKECNDAAPCPQHDLYKPIRQRLKDYLSTTTLADTGALLRSKSAWRDGRAAARKQPRDAEPVTRDGAGAGGAVASQKLQKGNTP